MSMFDSLIAGLFGAWCLEAVLEEPEVILRLIEYRKEMIIQYLVERLMETVKWCQTRPWAYSSGIYWKHTS